MEEKRLKKGNIFLLFLILSLGFFLRLYNLGSWGFWYDEVDSIFSGKFLIWHNILEVSIYTHWPGLFPFLLMRLWKYLGDGEFILRLLPLIFGILSIFAIYKIGGLLFNIKTGLISAFILCVSPFHIYYSQELRHYTLLTFLSLMAFFYLIQSLRSNKLCYWFGLIIFTAFSLNTHNVAIFLLIVENIFFIFFYKRYKSLLKRWLVSQLFIILFFLPHFAAIFGQTVNYQISNPFSVYPAANHLFNFIQSFIIFNSGYNSVKAIQFLAVLLFTPLFFLGIMDKNKKEEICLLLCWLFIPIILTSVLTILITHVYLFRTLVHISAAYYILIAYGISKLKPRNVYLFVLFGYAFLAGLGLKNYYQNYFPLPEFPYRIAVHPKKETRVAASYIENNFQKKDLIGHTNPVTYLPFFYYHKDGFEEKLFTLGYFTNFYSVYAKVLKFVKMQPVDIRELTKIKYDRIWLVFSSSENNQLDQRSKNIKDYFDRNYDMVESKEFVGIRIYLYEVK